MAGILWRPAIFFVPTITLRTLALTLLAALGVMQVLLWAFLGLGAGWIIGGALGLAALLWGLVRAPGWTHDGSRDTSDMIRARWLEAQEKE